MAIGTQRGLDHSLALYGRSRPRADRWAQTPRSTYCRKTNKLRLVSIIVAKNDAERGPCWLPARRQSHKLFLNDLKIGFDHGEIGASLIRLPQR